MATPASKPPGQWERAAAAAAALESSPSERERERPKLNTSRTTAHRLPPPALFQGPPSKNASHISLVLPGDRVPGAPGSDVEHPRPQRIHPPARVPAASSFSGPSLRQPAIEPEDQRAESLWAEMQKTLADVEVSAMNTSHVFGASHTKALDDLRAAQLSLAQTWAKTEADELHEKQESNAASGDNVAEVVGQQLDATPSNTTTTAGGGGAGATSSTTTPGRRKGGPQQQPGKANNGGSNNNRSAFTNNKNLEEETERDIQLARKRREANDRYFQQVNRGVLEVVSKLDEVAGAMRRVERESREIWDESSDGSISGTETGSVTDNTGLTGSPVSVRKGNFSHRSKGVFGKRCPPPSTCDGNLDPTAFMYALAMATKALPHWSGWVSMAMLREKAV
ncbi:hypothetical protein HRR78_002121 [Exophiala dermatitidis]|nr:hypothetical protein HRR78_002121 [Exophiala dermatitidis]